MLLSQSAIYKRVDVAQQVVGSSAAALTAPTYKLANATVRPDRIILQALPANTGTITVGVSSGVASVGAAMVVLSAGNRVELPINDYSTIYVIASAASQNLNISYCYGPQ